MGTDTTALGAASSPAKAPAGPPRTAPAVSRAGAGGGRQGLLAAARAELAEHGHGAISLRAVARRAGVSHAAPKYHFTDRAGLLTAVATEGFGALAAALREVATTDPQAQLGGIGRAYIDFGLTNPALFDLMFRPSELHPQDPALQHAQSEAIGILASTVAQLFPPSTPKPADVPPMALISWALVHGLVVLTRDGALGAAASAENPAAAADLARALTEVFTTQITQPPQKADRAPAAAGGQFLNPVRSGAGSP